MAVQDYQVQPAGDRKFVHNGALAHNGRLMTMDSTAAATAALVARGLIAAPTGGTQHDAIVTGAVQEAWQTYTVQAAGKNRIQYGTAGGGTLLAQGATLKLDPLEEPAPTLVARGWIA